MADVGQPDQLIEQFLEPSQVLWRNLCLLGLQVSEIINSAMARTTFELGPGMFLHGSNFKAQNMVLFFLFHRLDPTQATKNFAGIWPILDQRQDQEFRATTLKFLSDLERKGDIPRGTVQRSYLSCGFGTRLINLVWRFSEYVLHQVFQRDFPEFYTKFAFGVPDSSKMPLSLLNAHVGALEGRFLQENGKLLESVRQTSLRSQKYQRKIDSLAQSYRVTVQALDHAREAEKSFNQDICNKEAFSEFANVERSEKVERLGIVWEQLHELHSGSKAGCDLVETVLSEKVGSANLITRVYCEESKEKLTSQKDVNLQEIIDDFVNFFPKLSSSDLLISSENASAIDFQNENKVARQVSLQYSQLQHLRDILPKLSTEIDIIKASIAGLKTELRSSDERQNPETNHSSQTSSPDINRMGLVPPTPVMSRPLLPPFTQTPARLPVKLHPGAPLESAVKKISFSAKKPSRSQLKCPLPMASPCPNRNRP